MNSRAKILLALRHAQPGYIPLPQLKRYKQGFTCLKEQFISILKSIGSQVYEAETEIGVIDIVKRDFKDAQRIIGMPTLFDQTIQKMQTGAAPHSLSDVDVAIIKAHLGVAENGAVWITEDITGERILPFICQHLAVIINSKDIVACMHDAYDKIGGVGYGFGVFIAGPSKTADIEQSLVLGAHGPRTMTVFITA
ncbi:MAG: LUD domain-containing protein [Bacteroidota bacterium]